MMSLDHARSLSTRSWRKMRKSILVALLVFMSMFTVAMILPETARATTLFVGGGGPGNYTTIQAAVDAANPADTVHVYTGTYYENVVIDKSITLVGEDRDTTVVNASGLGDVILVTADWVNISDFTLKSDWAGLVLDYARNSCISRINVTDSWKGIRLLFAASVTIHDSNIVSNNDYGVDLFHSTGVVIKGTNITDNWGGILLRSGSGVLLEDNRFAKGANGVYSESTGDLVIRSNHISGFYVGISLNTASDVTIERNDINHNNRTGVRVFESTNVTIAGNEISLTDFYGIDVESSMNVAVTGNNISSNNWHGVDVLQSSNLTITDNNILSNAQTGISLVLSSETDISGNYFSDNGQGIHFSSSTNATIAGNVFAFDGIFVQGYVHQLSSLTITPDNLVDGKPILYYKNCEGLDINGISAGQIILVNFTNGLITGLHVTNTDTAIQMVHVEEVHVLGNNLSSNDIGIHMVRSKNVTISSNNLWHNHHGMLVSYSNGIRVSHNNVFSQAIQADEYLGEDNLWDDGYPSGGNYWSDYTGMDQFSGEEQNQPGGDGIGDASYTLWRGNHDRYPLMSPLNHPPSCAIRTPSPQLTVTGEYTISGTAFDPELLVEMVEVKVDGGPWTRADGTTSWAYEWDTTTVSNGEHTIFARSYDGSNRSSEVSVIVTVDNRSHERGDPLLGQVLFWTMVVSVIVIAGLGLMLEARRRKKE